MNRKVYLLAAALVLATAGIVTAKLTHGGVSIQPQKSRNLWRVNISINVVGQGDAARIRMTLPSDTPRQVVYNEHFDNDGLSFHVRDRSRSGNRIGFWQSQLVDGPKSIDYTFSAQLQPAVYPVPQGIDLPREPLEAYPPEFRSWLDPSKFIQSKDELIEEQLRKLMGRERKTDVVVKKIYDFVRGEVKYKSEKGSRDAQKTLKEMVADCGGQARLFAAFSRAAGMPSRIVGGIIMKSGVKNITHVWVENYIGGQWVPFDVVNGHYAEMPDDYLELYRSDYYLFKHSGFERFNYYFLISRERIPPVDHPWSLYALPAHFQDIIKVLLLVPVGALVVAFCRCVIGVPTLGTFTPILLALAFREISFFSGLVCLAVIVTAGCAVRYFLDQLKILVIPRLSIVVTLVVILVLVLMVAGYRMGMENMLYISFFPFVIMTWIIERFSVLQIEDGTKEAFKALAGTTAVSAAAYYLMTIHALRLYLFEFPELLLMIMAFLLLLGRYTGMRATELWRFREFKKMKLRRNNP